MWSRVGFGLKTLVTLVITFELVDRLGMLKALVVVNFVPRQAVFPGVVSLVDSMREKVVSCKVCCCFWSCRSPFSNISCCFYRHHLDQSFLDKMGSHLTSRVSSCKLLSLLMEVGSDLSSRLVRHFVSCEKFLSS